MKNIYKQLEELVIRLRTDPFESARIRLTGFYALATSVVAVVTSLFVYEIFINTIRNNIEYRLIVLQYGGDAGEMFATASATHLLKVLAYVDVGMILLITVVGFLFATRALVPIRTALKKEQQFIADAAHELRTPLAVMKTCVDTLPDDTMSIDEVRELKKDMLEEVEDLIRMTNDLLVLQREDMLHTSNKTHKTNLSDLVHDQMKHLSVYAKKSHIQYACNITDGIYIALDKQNTTRIIRNVIKNAIDYTKPGGKIFIELRKKDSTHAVFKVQDTGIGISKQDKKYIFDRFYTSKDNNTLQHGAGLGLSIVHALVMRIKGTIDVDSKEGVGSTFTITLPIIS